MRMMNRDDKQHGDSDKAASEQRTVKLEIMDNSSTAAVDDRKPPPVVQHQPAPGNDKALSSPEANLKPLVKRKRRSPEKPWKKPKDMPKRPLSAYNLFFRDERERLLSAGRSGDSNKKPEAASNEKSKSGGKKSKKTSGIGFANLAKTIAAKWKELSDEVKAPYEKIAAEEKKVYDAAVAEWRVKQKAKKKAQAAEKKAAEESRMVAMREPPLVPNLFSSERSLGSFSDSSNPYPSEWFHTHQEGEHSERSASERGTVPPVVDASPTAADRRAYDAASAWGGRHDSYYHQRYGTPEQQQHYQLQQQQHRYSQQHDYSRSGYGSLQPNLFSYDTSSTQSQAAAYRDYYQGYREYYQQHQQHPEQASAMHYHHRYADMRAARGTQQHMPQEYQQHDHHRAGRESADADPAYHQQQQQQQEHHLHPSSSRGRSASMPAMHQAGGPAPQREQPGEATLDESFRSEPGGYSRAAASASAHRQRQYNPAAAAEPPIEPVDPEEAVQDSLHSLTETLDDDAISFITSMKYS